MERPLPRAQPELATAGFAFLLHFPWEILQAPLYRGMEERPHWRAVLECLRATAGDVALTLVGLWIVALLWRSRSWIVSPSRSQLGVFVAVPLALTVVLERLNLELWRRWAYDPSMPVVPGLEIGLAPLLQWTALPLLTAWLVRRHLG